MTIDTVRTRAAARTAQPAEVNDLIEVFADARTVRAGRVVLILAPEGQVTVHTTTTSFELAKRAAAVIFPIEAVHVELQAGATVLGVSVETSAFGRLLDLGLGGTGDGDIVATLHTALLSQGLTHWQLPLSDTAYWGTVALLRVDNARAAAISRWEALQLATCIIRLIGPAIRRTFPTLEFGGSASKDQRLVQQATKILQAEYSRPLAVPELAARLNVSASTLNRAFKREIGVSVKDHLAAIRLSRFEWLLRQTSISVTEASRLVGFRSSSQIREKFREVHGVAASTWRASAAFDTHDELESIA
ncbi:MAG: helix-turn-helix transcriptional regulator [Agromyces sp.]